MKTVLILGAASDIARSLAHEFAKHEYHLQLAARRPNELEDHATDLRIRYDRIVDLIQFDALDVKNHHHFFQQLTPKPDGVVWVAGYLGDHEKAKTDPEELMKIVNTNYVGCVSILNQAAEWFEGQKSGFIIGFSSVAGDRGRYSNFYYGSTKAGTTSFLSGLRARLLPAGVSVITVKPGFINTKMTENLKQPPAPLIGEPEGVAKDVYNALEKGKDVVYTPWFWWHIMWIVKHIPEQLFKRLRA